MKQFAQSPVVRGRARYCIHFTAQRHSRKAGLVRKSRTQRTQGSSRPKHQQFPGECPKTSVRLRCSARDVNHFIPPLLEPGAAERAGGHFVKRRRRWWLLWAPGSRSRRGCRPRGEGTRAGGNSGLGSGAAQLSPVRLPQPRNGRGCAGLEPPLSGLGRGLRRPPQASAPAAANAPHKRVGV